MGSSQTPYVCGEVDFYGEQSWRELSIDTRRGSQRKPGLRAERKVDEAASLTGPIWGLMIKGQYAD